MVLTWSNLPSEQKAFVAALDQKLLNLSRLVKPATFYDTDEPTAADVVSGVYQRTQWINPENGAMENVYQRVEDSATPYTTTHKPYPLVPVPAGRMLTPIAEISVGAVAGAATLTFSAIPQTFEHLYLYVHYRSTAAAASTTVNLQVSGLASGYSMSYQGHNGNMSYGAETTSAIGFAFTAPANTALGHLFLDGWFEFPTYTLATRTTRMRGRVASVWGNPVTNATLQGYNAFGIQNALSAITSISLVGTTGTAPGTRLVLFGM